MLNITHLIDDGFEKVCDVKNETDKNYWYYENINQGIMFSKHRSWIYFIANNDIIVKIGESGNPLGIPMKSQRSYQELQPKCGTDSRLGRYRRHGETDSNIREKLKESVDSGLVSIWAKKCPIIKLPQHICGKEIELDYSSHKFLEIIYLDLVKELTNKFPELNQCRK